jgi:hypothetical protein
MVDHGATAHFVFLTFAVGSLVVFAAFQVNARISDAIERRDVMFAMACLFAGCFVVVYLAPTPPAFAPSPLPGPTGWDIWAPGPG